MQIDYINSKMEDSKTILFLHGANSTSRTFNFIRQGLPDHNSILVNYDSNIPILDTLNDLRRDIKPYSVNYVVSHSLGGILAVLLSQLKTLDKIVSISTPYGGSKFADWMKYIPMHTSLFSEIASQSQLIKHIKKMRVIPPVFSIVTTSTPNNMPSYWGESDGVVSVESQTSLQNAQYKKYNLNHFETLIDEQVRNDITDFLYH